MLTIHSKVVDEPYGNIQPVDVGILKDEDETPPWNKLLIKV